MGYAKRKNSLYSFLSCKAAARRRHCGACTTRAAKIWRLLSVWPFSSFPPKSVFLVGVAGKGRMMDRQSATKQLPSTSCERFHRNIGQKFSAEFIIIINLVEYVFAQFNAHHINKTGTKFMRVQILLNCPT